MNQGNDIANKDFVMELMKSTGKEDLNYIYRGEFTQTLQQHILSLAEKNIDREKISGKIKKRVFHIMVESIQNISRHGDGQEESADNSAMFSIQKEKKWYYITTSNIIENSKIDNLKGKLDKVNSLDQTELDKFYREVLGNGQLSSKGGAGLGLIEMVRKSGNKLTYNIEKINDEISHFYLHSYINTTTLEEAPEQPDDSIFSLNYMVKLHNFILSNNILLIYSAVFDQESLLSLVSIMKNQMDGNANSKKKIISMMVEMLQNIIHHGNVSIGDINGAQGIFYISVHDDKYYLTTINYIHNDKVDTLKKKIDHINSLDEKELEDFYNSRLFDFRICSSTEAGLGLIEMRQKSKNDLEYQFSKANDEYSLFKISTCINR
ncbi:MAG: SiaB family protein kinase [Bacteroidales bacterium]|nr:SiaB family protein kinase [Bacteroidales bacterium]